MTAKQYLRQAYRLNDLINTNVEELDDLRALSASIKSQDYMQDRVQTSQAGDKIGDIAAKIVDLETKINDEIDCYVDLKSKIHDSIESMKVRNEKLVLRYRYIVFLTWEQIAEKMNYSIIQVQRIHSVALQNFVIPKT